MVTIDRERILALAKDDYIEELSNTENVNPEKAGRRAAKARILKELANAYNVMIPELLPAEGRGMAWELWMEHERRMRNE